MVEKKDSKKKNGTNNPDPQDIINTATGAAGGVPKPVIDAGTKPPKRPKDPVDEKPEDHYAGETVDMSTPKPKK